MTEEDEAFGYQMNLQYRLGRMSKESGEIFRKCLNEDVPVGTFQAEALLWTIQNEKGFDDFNRIMSEAFPDIEIRQNMMYWNMMTAIRNFTMNQMAEEFVKRFGQETDQ